MKPNKESIRPLLIRMIQANQLLSDGPFSLFIQEKHRTWRSHAQQLVVSVRDDAVIVRCSRLPFARPLTFSLPELREEAQRSASSMNRF